MVCRRRFKPSPSSVALAKEEGLKSGVGTPPSIASNRDFGLGGVSVSSVSKHKKLGPPEFQNLISRFTDSGGAGVRQDPNGGVAVVELRSGIWYNMRHETVVQLQDQPVLPSDQPHCPPRVLPG